MNEIEHINITARTETLLLSQRREVGEPLLAENYIRVRVESYRNRDSSPTVTLLERITSLRSASEERLVAQMNSVEISERRKDWLRQLQMRSSISDDDCAEHRATLTFGLNILETFASALSFRTLREVSNEFVKDSPRGTLIPEAHHHGPLP